MTADTFAQELLNEVAAQQPEVVDLARLVSLAVRIEPVLLRRIRLEMLPHVDAGTESDLWWSPLIGSRSVDAAVLDKDAMRLLRAELAARPDQLDQVYHIIRSVHQGTSPIIELEEEVIWLGLRGGAGASGQIEAALRRALRAMVEQPDRGRNLARWADRALPTFPVSALGTEAAGLLALAAIDRLGPGAGLLQRPVDLPIPAGGGWVRSSATPLSRSRLGVRLTAGKLEFTAVGVQRTGTIDFAGTLPMLAELRVDGLALRNAVVIYEGAVIDLPLRATALTLRTQYGDEFQVSARRYQPTPSQGYRVAKVLVVGQPGAGIPLLLQFIAGPSKDREATTSRVRVISFKGVNSEDVEQNYEMALWAASEELLWPLALDLGDAHAVVVVAQPGKVEEQTRTWLNRVRALGSEIPVIPAVVGADPSDSSTVRQELVTAAKSLGLRALDDTRHPMMEHMIRQEIDWRRPPRAASRGQFHEAARYLPGGERNLEAAAGSLERLGAGIASARPPIKLSTSLSSVVRVAQALGRVRMLAGEDLNASLVVQYEAFTQGILGMLVRAQRGRDGLPVGNFAGIAGLVTGDGTHVEPRSYFLQELVRLGVALEEGDEYIVPSLLKVTATGGCPEELSAMVVGMRWLGPAAPVWLGLLARLTRDGIIRVDTIGADWAVISLMMAFSEPPEASPSEASRERPPIAIRFSQDGEAAELRVVTLPGWLPETRELLAERLQAEVLSRVPTGTTVQSLTEGVDSAGLAEQGVVSESPSVASTGGPPKALPPLRVYVSATGRDGGPRLVRFTEQLAIAFGSALNRSIHLNGFIPSEMALGSESEGVATLDLFGAELFIAILTEDYLNSGWCGREFAAFTQARVPGLEASGRVWLLPWKGRLPSPLPDAMRLWRVMELPTDGMGLETIVETHPELVQVLLVDLIRRQSGLLEGGSLPPGTPLRELREFPPAFGSEDLTSTSTGSSADLEWAVPMLHALAMAFHMGRVDGVALDERHAAYGLRDSDIDDFEHVRMMSEFLYHTPLLEYLNGDRDPFKPDPRFKGALRDFLSQQSGSESWRLLQRALGTIGEFGEETDLLALTRALGMRPDEAARIEWSDRRMEMLRRATQRTVVQDILERYSAPFFEWPGRGQSSASTIREFPTYLIWVLEHWLSYVDRLVQPSTPRTVVIQAERAAALNFFRGFPSLRPPRLEEGENSDWIGFALTLTKYRQAVQSCVGTIDPFLQPAWIRQGEREEPPEPRGVGVVVE